MTFDLQPADVKPLVERAIAANRLLAEKFGVRVRLDARTADAAVYTDDDRLVQVLGHLLSNAVKFSPAGEEAVVFIDARDDHVRIAVRDHGPGIPHEFKALIFEKFAQIDSTDARQKGGTGLGLSIVKQTMIRLGGGFGCDSPSSGGAVFHVDVPRFKADALADRVPEAAAEVA